MSLWCSLLNKCDECARLFIGINRIFQLLYVRKNKKCTYEYLKTIQVYYICTWPRKKVVERNGMGEEERQQVCLKIKKNEILVDVKKNIFFKLS